MGYLGVKTMVAHLKGEKVERTIDTGVHLATRDNMDTARDEGAALAGSLAVAEVSRARRVRCLEMRGIRQALRRDGRARRRRPRRRRRARSAAWSGRTAPGKSTLMAHPRRRDRSPTRARWPSTAGPTRRRNPIEARRAGVAMIHQELSLAPHLSVTENILLGVEPARFGFLQRSRDGRDRHPRARRARARRSRSRHARRRRWRCRSSRSSRSRARSPSAAACWCSTSRPAASAARTRASCSRMLGRLRDQGHAIVYISHFLEEVTEDRRSLRRAARRPERRRRADGRRHARRIVGDDDRRQRRGRCFRARPRDGRRADADAWRRSSRATRRFTLHRGEVFGIAGLIGAGRTRLLRTLFGLEPVRSGRLTLGVYSGPGDAARALAAGHGHAERGPQARRARGRAEHRRQPDHHQARAFRVRGHRLARSGSGTSRAAGSSGWPSGAPGPAQPVGELSGGNQQKVALARLLYHERRRARPRRADARHRRVQQGADLCAHRRAGRRRRAAARRRRCSWSAATCRSCSASATAIAVMFRGRLQAARPVAELTESELMVATMTGGIGAPHDRPHRCSIAPARSSGWCWSRWSSPRSPASQFIAPGNLELMARQTAIVCMAAIGMTAVIVAGGIDLSVGSVISLTTVVIAVLLKDGRSPLAAALGRRRRGGRLRTRQRRSSSRGSASCRSSSRSGRC